MKPEVKAPWLEALRSNEYKQGRFCLRTRNDEYCCLGVLCDLAEKAGVVTKVPSATQISGLPCWAYGTESRNGFLPTEVMEWAGVVSPSPICNNQSLSYYNDGGKTFSEIADMIEECL